ncbi:AraC family transcriptional regulator [bacterium]|nr:AraC family transcriptional regulator [bacterium]
MRTTTWQDYQDRILAVLNHIQQNLDEDLGWRDLARIAHFSPHHFHRIFSGMVGESIGEHIRRIRLERAAYRLLSTHQSVTVIAFDAGFETHESFTRAFRDWFGMAPSSYRRTPSPPQPRQVPTIIHYQPAGVLHGFTPIISGGTKMEVSIVEIPRMRVACMRHTGPGPDCGPVVDSLDKWARRRGLVNNKTVFVGVSYGPINYDACVTVDEKFEPSADDEGVEIQEIGGGEYARVLHEGPLERLGETYAYIIGQWAPHSGRELAHRPCLEFPKNDPSSTPPEDIRMEICVALE